MCLKVNFLVIAGGGRGAPLYKPINHKCGWSGEMPALRYLLPASLTTDSIKISALGALQSHHYLS